MCKLVRSAVNYLGLVAAIPFAASVLLPAAPLRASETTPASALPVVRPGPGMPPFQMPNVAPPGPIGPNFGQPADHPPVVQPQFRPQLQPQPVGGNKAGKPGVFGGAIEGAIAGGIGGALVGLMLWALRKTANTAVKIDPATGGIVAEYAPGLRYMMYAFGAFTPTVLVIVAFCKPPQHDGGWAIIAVVIFLFVALGGSLGWGLGRARAIATDQGIISSSGFRKQRSMLWSDVAEVSYLKTDAALRFKSIDPKQRPIKVGLMMAGLKPFAERMRQHVSPDRYAKAEEALQRIGQLSGGAALPFMGFAAKPATKPKPIARA